MGQLANLGRIGYEVAKRKVNRLQNLDSSDQFLDELFTMREEDTVPIERKDIPFLNILYGKENKYYNYDVFTDNVNELGQYTREINKGETDAQGLNFVACSSSMRYSKAPSKDLSLLEKQNKMPKRLRTTSIGSMLSINLLRLS